MEEKDKLILNQAYGIVKMKIYSYTDGQYKHYFGVLDNSDQENIENLESNKITVKVRPRIEKTLENRVSFSQLVNSDKSVICGVYPKTTLCFKLKRFSLQSVYSNESKASGRLNSFTIRGRVDYINIEKQVVIIRIAPESTNLKEFDMAVRCQDIKNELENIEYNQYWQINARLVNNEFILQSGSMIQDKTETDNNSNVIFKTPKLKSYVVDKIKDKTDNISDVVPTPELIVEAQLVDVDTVKEKTKRKKKKKNSETISSTDLQETQLVNTTTTSDVVSASAPTSETLLAVNTATSDTTPKQAPTLLTQLVKQTESQEGTPRMQVKSEVVVKISGALPQATPAPNKKVQVEVTDQNGINFTAIINGKSWKKAEASVTQFADWAGAISGKLGKTEQGLEIVDAGIQIFEKKPKEPKPEENPS